VKFAVGDQNAISGLPSSLQQALVTSGITNGTGGQGWSFLGDMLNQFGSITLSNYQSVFSNPMQAANLVLHTRMVNSFVGGQSTGTGLGLNNNEISFAERLAGMSQEAQMNNATNISVQASNLALDRIFGEMNQNVAKNAMYRQKTAQLITTSRNQAATVSDRIQANSELVANGNDIAAENHAELTKLNETVAQGQNMQQAMQLSDQDRKAREDLYQAENDGLEDGE
jgi:hypothetical protein